MMVRFELKKVFAKTSSKIALVLLLAILGVVCCFAMSVSYVNENGITETGPAAVSKLRATQKEWTGYLDEEKLRQVIEENRQISQTPQAQSTDHKENDVAYSWKQGFSEIRDLLNYSCADGFRTYDYYRADSLNADAADHFYSNRIILLKAWLEDEGKNQFSDAEKEYLIQQYEGLDTPLYYDYMKGWTQLLEYTPTIMMITVLILAYLVGGIFSNEFQWRADSIFFASAYGRNKAVAAKIKAGFLIITAVFWVTILLYTGLVLLYLGADGAGCPVQADVSGWKCFYNIQIWQKYLYTVVGGYVGCLFISFLSMVVSAKTKSAVLAVMLPFVLIFIPSFLGNISHPVVSKILGLLPDRLLQLSVALNYFDLYQLGQSVTGAVPILLSLYGILTILLLPVTYQEYRHKQIS